MNLFNNLLNIIMDIVEHLGYPGVFFAVFLEYACVPLPSEVILPFVGLMSSAGPFNIVWVFIISILAGITGSTLCYFLGYYLGAPLIKWLSSHSSGARKSFNKLDIILRKYGKPAVAISRILPLTRTYISLLAGAVNMNYWEFILYSLGGIALWNVVLITLGHKLGENALLINTILKDYSIFALILIFIICVICFIKLSKKRTTR